MRSPRLFTVLLTIASVSLRHLAVAQESSAVLDFIYAVSADCVGLC